MFSSCALLILCTFLGRAYSQVVYADKTTNCATKGPMLGNAVYCCSGACLDGTRIGEPGQCNNWLNLCGDVNSPPSCSSNQVLSYGDPATIDSGDGCCGACCCECQYQRNNWTWSCCDCPAGYVAVDGGACGGTASPSCVGCQQPDQMLTGDSSTGFQCVNSQSSNMPSMTPTPTQSPSETPSSTPNAPSSVPSPSNTPSASVSPSQPNTPSNTPSASLSPSQSNGPSNTLSASNGQSQSIVLSKTGAAPSASPSFSACDKARAVDDAVNRIGTLSTDFGYLCPTNNLESVFISLGETIVADAQSSTDNTEGFANTVNSATSGLILGAAAILGAGIFTVESPILLGIGAAYEAACTANTYFGGAATLAGVGMNAIARIECGEPISKRLVSRSSSSNMPRGVLYNPCSEFLSYFTADTSFPSTLDQTCTQLYSDTTYQNITGNLQEACHKYQDSGNSTLMIDFANFLAAIRAYEPYCETSTASSPPSYTLFGPSTASLQTSQSRTEQGTQSALSSSCSTSVRLPSNPYSVNHLPSTATSSSSAGPGSTYISSKYLVGSVPTYPQRLGSQAPYLSVLGSISTKTSIGPGSGSSYSLEGLHGYPAPKSGLATSSPSPPSSPYGTTVGVPSASVSSSLLATRVAMSSTKTIGNQPYPAPAPLADSATYNTPVIAPGTSAGASGPKVTTTTTSAIPSPLGTSMATIPYFTGSSATSLRSDTASGMIVKLAVVCLPLGVLWL